jgi:hypothetical protein
MTAPPSFRGGQRAAGHELFDALVKTGFVEVAAVFDQDLVQVPFTEHDDMIQALPPDAAEEALTHSIRAWCADGGLDHSRADPPGRAVEVWAELVIPIPDDEPRTDPDAFRICWATHTRLGSRVTPTCTTLREPCSIMKNAKIGRNHRS